MNRIQKTLLTLLGSLGRMKVRGLPRALVIVLMLLIIGSVVLYLAGWIWLWAALRRVDLPALNQLLQTLTSASFIAAAGFILRALIDEDGDDVPDFLQYGDKKSGDERKDDVNHHGQNQRNPVPAEQTDDIRNGRRV